MYIDKGTSVGVNRGGWGISKSSELFSVSNWVLDGIFWVMLSISIYYLDLIIMNFECWMAIKRIEKKSQQVDSFLWYKYLSVS